MYIWIYLFVYHIIIYDIHCIYYIVFKHYVWFGLNNKWLWYMYVLNREFTVTWTNAKYWKMIWFYFIASREVYATYGLVSPPLTWFPVLNPVIHNSPLPPLNFPLPIHSLNFLPLSFPLPDFYAIAYIHIFYAIRCFRASP